MKTKCPLQNSSQQHHMVSVILDNLSEGSTFDEIVAEYPTITHEDIQASIQYASYLTSDKIIPIKS